jgi:hypothetical protein
MDFGLVILPPFASQRAGDLFWPAADLASNLGPSKTQRSAQAYGIAKIRVRCSTRSSATVGNGPLPAAISLIELNRSPYVFGLSQNESLSLPHFAEQSCAVPERPN